jgi:surface-anchored protein
VNAEEPIHVWPQNENVDQIFLGFSSTGTIPQGTFATYFESDPRVAGTARWLKIQLAGFTFHPDPADSATNAPHFSLWQSSLGGSTVWMSTVDGITASDATWLIEGGHAHYNWGFSRRGYYKIRFQYSGVLNDGSLTPVESELFTTHFGVEYQPLAIPEPGAAASLWLVGCLGVAILRPRKIVRSRQSTDKGLTSRP